MKTLERKCEDIEKYFKKNAEQFERVGSFFLGIYLAAAIIIILYSIIFTTMLPIGLFLAYLVILPVVSIFLIGLLFVATIFVVSLILYGLRIID